MGARNPLARLPLLAALGWLVAAPAPAAEPATRLWQPVVEANLGAPAENRRLVSARRQTLRLERAALEDLLARTPPESAPTVARVAMELPWPTGGFKRFRIEESPIMEAGLAAQFPEIKTYRGRGIDDRSLILRFDWTPAGFHAMVLSAGETVYVDPWAPGDSEHYVSYFKRDYRRNDGAALRCSVVDEPDELAQAPLQAPHGTQLRTYRLALAATGEYTAVFGGTVAGALAAMTTTMNRVVGIYERDLAVRMVMVANNNLIVYTNAATDPYTNTSGSTMLGQNQSNLDAVIGSANYDIGHVFSTGGGGVAQLNVPCTSSKARGVTGSSSPSGDGFDVDYVAHEMGHQFGGSHTFNGTTNNCGGGNRSGSSAYEPGSGSTIQAYAGICGAEDLQPHSDDYFHARSQDQMIAFITGATGNSCAVVTATGNTPPTANAGGEFTIPRSTPFALTASGSDANGDTLSYTWEQFNLGTASPPNTDDGTRPIFRSFTGTTSPVRTFPRLSNLLANTTLLGESLPTTTRSLAFRVTVRDNRVGGGGTASDEMLVNVRADAGPFLVTQPNTGVAWPGGSSQLVTWDVANTAAAPIGATNVKISFSSDGGNSFPTVLAASTPNDGAETISVPVGVTTQARIKVEAVGNVFFDLSDVNFQVTAAGGSQLSIADAVVMEGDSGTADVLVAVTLSPASSQVVSVTATTSSGTAASPGDYVHTQVPVTFGIGETLQFVSIPIVGDTQPEPHESFSVTLGSPAGATLADAVASVSVGNDDRPAADFDGNGISDVVVYRNGAWLFFNVPPGIRRPD